MLRTSFAETEQLNKVYERKKFIPNREAIRTRSFTKLENEIIDFLTYELWSATISSCNDWRPLKE